MQLLVRSRTRQNLGQRVLVVEDEPLIRETVALALSEVGFQVLVTENGRAALDLIEKFEADNDPNSSLDLIVLDLMLPFMNGLDVCRLLRQRGNQIPILMLSARGAETDKVVGLEIGADDYLTKPFGIRELIARCRVLLRRCDYPQNQDQEQLSLRFQEITLYPLECRVIVRGKEVSLAPKEFALLELFIRNPRRVMSRDYLLEKVWGVDYIGETKTVDVHIRWLREKIEIDPSKPQYLVTVRGFGYRLG